MVERDVQKGLEARAPLIGVVLGALLWSACGGMEPGRTHWDDENPEVEFIGCEAEGLDAWMVQLTQEVPGGFGGYFLDDGVPTAYLMDLTQADAAAIALARATGFSPLRFQFLQGQVDFVTLENLRCTLTRSELLDDVRWVALDIDERRNRVRVGVEDAQEQARLEMRLAGRGVDTRLILVEVVARIRALSVQQAVSAQQGGSAQ